MPADRKNEHSPRSFEEIRGPGGGAGNPKLVLGHRRVAKGTGQPVARAVEVGDLGRVHLVDHGGETAPGVVGGVQMVHLAPGREVIPGRIHRPEQRLLDGNGILHHRRPVVMDAGRERAPAGDRGGAGGVAQRHWHKRIVDGDAHRDQPVDGRGLNLAPEGIAVAQDVDHVFDGNHDQVLGLDHSSTRPRYRLGCRQPKPFRQPSIRDSVSKT